MKARTPNDVRVTLLDYQSNAKELMLFTKQTRLTFDPNLMEEIKNWPDEKKQEELDYMRGTIQSSWEFVRYIFLVENVTRAYTHQLVRTRTQSYAQQSQRTVDMQGFEYTATGELLKQDNVEGLEAYTECMDKINEAYQKLVNDCNIPPQDARGVLPTNVHTKIVVGTSLRNMADTAKTRLCTRTQGEYQIVFQKMREEIIKVHPWAADFMLVGCAAHGTCIFPNYKKCPIKPGIFDPVSGGVYDENGEPRPLRDGERPLNKEEILSKWSETNYEAIPDEHKDAKRGSSA